MTPLRLIGWAVAIAGTSISLGLTALMAYFVAALIKAAVVNLPL